ncbi:hypothetical protein IQ24_02936 [Paracoccus sulfuroxidans]|uniref:Uncharacterized protein n=2 Tax=Paracoccus sulfuroxidans TaxID=384678 RepID=A0A562NHA6_9RHOB|nr:hypothetical protein IQ24_02936 [Paracoccus sulfuroxidans]
MAALLALLTQAAAAQSVPERKILLPAADELTVANQQAEGRALLLELIPTGETLESWTRLVTLTNAPDLGAVPEDTALKEFATRYAGACGGNSQETPLDIDQKGMKGLRLDCSKAADTGKLETVFVRMIDTGADMAIVQVAFRGLAVPSDAQWARDYLAGVKVE